MSNSESESTQVNFEETKRLKMKTILKIHHDLQDQIQNPNQLILLEKQERRSNRNNKAFYLMTMTQSNT